MVSMKDMIFKMSPSFSVRKFNIIIPLKDLQVPKANKNNKIINDFIDCGFTF